MVDLLSVFLTAAITCTAGLVLLYWAVGPEALAHHAIHTITGIEVACSRAYRQCRKCITARMVHYRVVTYADALHPWEITSVNCYHPDSDTTHDLLVTHCTGCEDGELPLISINYRCRSEPENSYTLISNGEVFSMRNINSAIAVAVNANTNSHTCPERFIYAVLLTIKDPSTGDAQLKLTTLLSQLAGPNGDFGDTNGKLTLFNVLEILCSQEGITYTAKDMAQLGTWTFVGAGGTRHIKGSESVLYSLHSIHALMRPRSVI